MIRKIDFLILLYNAENVTLLHKGPKVITKMLKNVETKKNFSSFLGIKE